MKASLSSNTQHNSKCPILSAQVPAAILEMVNDVFPFLEIIIPFVTFGIAVLCCTSICKACHNAREERLDQPDRPSILVIPIPADDSPPRYSTTEIFGLPPPYAEVEMKPHLFPLPEGLPPAYTEVVFSPAAPSPPTPPPLPPPAAPLHDTQAQDVHADTRVATNF
ncbi:hypothetical protein MATL_G00212840 [Megalops atlanticus]|uniref:Transmembrane protein 92 n=1 Tax=Megalops atlanticus TaxID=7932 RepID=A0A9D3PI25_MEGAT|nr:hypothetical protein MATL_G00212840 [Megalops atlanticus]